MVFEFMIGSLIGAWVGRNVPMVPNEMRSLFWWVFPLNSWRVERRAELWLPAVDVVVWFKQGGINLAVTFGDLNADFRLESSVIIPSSAANCSHFPMHISIVHGHFWWLQISRFVLTFNLNLMSNKERHHPILNHFEYKEINENSPCKLQT